jgi:hypothetical protein
MTPNDSHYALAAQALDAGLDVVVDKPVTHDFAQACDLVARTRKNGRVLAIAHGILGVSDDALRAKRSCVMERGRAAPRPGSNTSRGGMAMPGPRMARRTHRLRLGPQLRAQRSSRW